jgi:hypothetical protein
LPCNPVAAAAACQLRSRSAIAVKRANAGRLSMSKDELVIQLIKIALGILIAGYFFWWSLEVLKRLPPLH